MNRIEALALVSELINSNDLSRKSIGAEIKRMLDFVIFKDEIVTSELPESNPTLI